VPYSPEVIAHVQIALQEIEKVRETGEGNLFTGVSEDDPVRHMLVALGELAEAVLGIVQTEPAV
jgi:predicted TIM-barrel enzyme